MNEFLKILLVFSLLLLSVLSFQANAEAEISKLEISLDGKILIPGTTLKLKALALQSNSNLDINNLNLLAIEILAKSRQGNGTIRLRVGEELTAWTNVAGTQKDFDHSTIDSFSTIKLRSPVMGKGKVWQLIINGYIKIKMITLHTIQEAAQSVRLKNNYHRTYTLPVNENIVASMSVTRSIR